MQYTNEQPADAPIHQRGESISDGRSIMKHRDDCYDGWIFLLSFAKNNADRLLSREPFPVVRIGGNKCKKSGALRLRFWEMGMD